MNTAIILARQNSKGIPHKNLRTVGGQSLVARAIHAARESALFDHILVSTDGQAIAEEARAHGAHVIDRPSELATDRADSLGALLHALDSAGIAHGAVVLLQPTSPLRTAEHICQAMQLFDAQGRMGAVVAACPAEHHPYKTLVACENGGFQAVRQTADLSAARQSLPAAYRPNGAVYINDIAQLQAERTFFTEPLQLYLMDSRASVDIDHESDLALAEQYWREQNTE